MKNYSVSCVIYVRGFGEPVYSITPPSTTIAEYGKVEAINTYLHRLLYDPAIYPYLQNSYLIVPAAKEIPAVMH